MTAAEITLGAVVCALWAVFLILSAIGTVCLERLEVIYSEYGIVINKKKTKIVDLKHGFTFLKTHFYITETGRIIKKPCRDSITRERRKLKKAGGSRSFWRPNLRRGSTLLRLMAWQHVTPGRIQNRAKHGPPI